MHSDWLILEVDTPLTAKHKIISLGVKSEI